MSTTTPTPSAVEVSIEEQVATVTLNRPEVRNAIDDAMRAELIAHPRPPRQRRCHPRHRHHRQGQGLLRRRRHRRHAAEAQGAARRGRLQWLAAPEAHPPRHLGPAHAAASRPSPRSTARPWASAATWRSLATSSSRPTAATFGMSFIQRGLDPRRRRHVLPAAPGRPAARQGADLHRPQRDRPRRRWRSGIADRVASPDTLLAEARAWAVELSRGSPAALALAKSILNQTFELPERAGLRPGQPGAGDLLHDPRAPGIGRGLPGQVRRAGAPRHEALGRLFRPRSVAVIGASADPTKMTGRPVAYLQKHGFAGAICR